MDGQLPGEVHLRIALLLRNVAERGGAAVYAALQVAKRLGTGKRVVTVIPDSAERYLSKDIFELKK